MDETAYVELAPSLRLSENKHHTFAASPRPWKTNTGQRLRVYNYSPNEIDIKSTETCMYTLLYSSMQRSQSEPQRFFINMS